MQIEFEKYIKSREKELASNFNDTYKDIRKELLKIYNKYEVDNKIDFDELRKYNRLNKLDDIILSSIAANSLLNKKAINKLLNDVVDKTEKDSFGVINSRATINPIKRKFDTKALVHKEVAGKAWEERLKHHTANFMYDVHGIVRQGLEQGDSYTTMAKAVKKKFGKEVKKELFLVRTEARRIQEFTKFETMKEVDKQVGLVKVWHTMKDEAVRSTHQAMEGVEVGMDEEFTLPSGATCLTPTGTGLPEEDCNCRCFIEYKVANDEAKVNDETEVEEDITENQGKYTKEEIDEALDSYVSGGGMWVNNNLRGVGEAAEYPLSEDDKIYIEKLDQATNNIVKEKTLYRSTDISSVLGDISDLDYDNLKSAYLYNDKSKPAQEALEKYLKNIEGKEIVDKGFMSTTKSKDIALDFQDFTGWWPKNASIESIGAHEFGHSINFDLIRKNKNYIDIVDHAFDWNNDITATKIVNQACDDIVKTSYGKGKSIKELREAQSLYGASNPSEAVAEAFADIYANKGKANPLSIRIVEIIDDMLKNSGGN